MINIETNKKKGCGKPVTNSFFPHFKCGEKGYYCKDCEGKYCILCGDERKLDAEGVCEQCNYEHSDTYDGYNPLNKFGMY